MATQSRSPSTGFSWLSDGISAGFRHPTPLLGGAALMLLATLIPMLITFAVQFHFLRSATPPPPTALGWITMASSLFNLLLVPLQAGYLQVVDAAENNQATRASDIFKPYLKGEALRLIGYGLVLMVAYFALFAIIGIAMGGDFANWHSQVLTAQINHQPPPAVFPKNFWFIMPTLLVLCPLMLGFFAISLGQVALNNRGVFSAIGDGIIGTLKNVLPLLVFVVGLILGWIVTVFAVGIVFALFAVFAKLIGALLIAVLIIPLYIAFALILFTSMYGVMYHIWCDVCCIDTATGTAQPVVA